MTVVLDKREMGLSLDGKSLRIDCPDAPVQRVPLGMVGQVIVYGNPMVGCSVWRKLSEMGIPALLLPGRGPGEPAWIGPGLSTAVMVRIAQFRAWSDTAIKSRAVVWLLKEKFNGTIRLAQTLEQGTGSLQESLLLLDETLSIDTLRGIEGAGAREWFGILADLLDTAWQFSGRNRRPPRDPVNALLSLGYTLLVSEVRKAVHARGLDPCIGFLHDPYPGRDSLVLDLTEPLRPGVDAFVLGLVEETLTPEDFTTGQQEGCRLSKEARGIFYGAWEEWKQNWPMAPALDDRQENFPTLSFVCRNLVETFVRSWGVPDTESTL